MKYTINIPAVHGNETHAEEISQFVFFETREVTACYTRRGQINPRITSTQNTRNARLQFPEIPNTALTSLQRDWITRLIFFCVSCVWGNKLQFWPERLLSLKKRCQNAKYRFDCVVLSIVRLPWRKFCPMSNPPSWWEIRNYMHKYFSL
jgi:hypothetical protein